MERLEDDHNLTFVRSTLNRAIRERIMSIMNDEAVEIAFEAAAVPTATRSTMVRAPAKVLLTEEAFIAPEANFVASKAQKEGSEAAQQSIGVAPLSPPTSFDGSSLSEDDCKEAKPKKYLRREKEQSPSRSGDTGP